MNQQLYDIHNSINILMKSRYNMDCKVIYTPECPGNHNSVFLADADNGATYVFKLTGDLIAQKNYAISQLLVHSDIPVPNVQIMRTRHQIFETYQIIPGQTLYEKVQEGKCTPAQITKAYRDVLGIMHKIELAGRIAAPDMPMMRSHDIARFNITHITNRWLIELFTQWFRCKNLGAKRDQCLSHFDLTQKNIILNDNNDVVGIIDLDTIGMCNRHYALAVLLEPYIQMGYDINEALDYYEALTGIKVNRRHITTLMKISNLRKKMLPQVRPAPTR